MHAPYRAYPDPQTGIVHLYPLIRVRIGKKHAQASRHFEAMVDSGSSDCIFQESIASAIGIKIESGKKEVRNGIGGPQDVWIHPIQLYVGMTDIIEINAAFAKTLPMAGLLGRIGFFEHFKITFDPSSDPPGLEIERIHKT
jgi:hypothetical protein